MTMTMTMSMTVIFSHDSIVIEYFRFQRRSPFPSTVLFSQVDQMSWVSDSIRKLIQTACQEIDEVVGKFEGINLPVFEDGKVKEFNNAFNDQMLRALQKANGGIEKSMACVQKQLDDLKLPHSFVPQLARAKMAAGKALTSTATITACRILLSKAASKKNGLARQNAKDCMEFCRQHSVEIPATLQALLSEL